MNKILIALSVLVVLIGGIYLFTKGVPGVTYEAETPVDTTEVRLPVEPDGGIGDGAEPLDELLEEAEKPYESSTVLGTTEGGRDITAYHFGNGDKELILVGGIHGGYSWNTALVAYDALNYFKVEEDRVPEGMKVTIIPVLNPDGLAMVTDSEGDFTSADVDASESKRVAGRFNGNEVDLNRNFDCQWQTDGVWQNRAVSGGDAPFSEAESAAFRDYVATANPEAVVVYYAAAGGVYASQCGSETLSETVELTAAYASAAGYKANAEFDFYDITGDMVNWLAKENIPAISVLLSDHQDPEWKENKAGIEAVLKYLAE